MRYSSVLGPAVFIMEMELLKNPSVGYRSDESITFKLELSTQFYLTTISLRCFLKYSSFDTSVPLQIKYLQLSAAYYAKIYMKLRFVGLNGCAFFI